MQVKTFEAMSIKDAVKAVKTEFGSNAVILRTKEKMVENNKVFEVTAAVPETGRSLGASFSQNNQQEQADLSQLEERFENLEIKVGNLSESMARKTQLSAIESGVEELKLLVMEALRGKDGSLMKDLPLPLADLSKHLQIMGIDEAQLTQLTKYLQELPPPGSQDNALPESAAEYYKSNAIRWMLKRIQLAPRLQPSKGRMSIHTFIGPSGSGKTSLSAKVAANAAKQHKCKVLMVSFDNQRLAASEQLRIYAKILNVAFEVIDSAQELEQILSKHKDAELVIIDTAGRSPKNVNKLNDLQELSKLSLPIEFHLVLSVTEKAQQLDRCVRSFASLSLASLCFTKLDESWSYGEIYNLTSKWTLPLSFFATGQRIPEDVERASKERVIERIFAL